MFARKVLSSTGVTIGTPSVVWKKLWLSKSIVELLHRALRTWMTSSSMQTFRIICHSHSCQTSSKVSFFLIQSMRLWFSIRMLLCCYPVSSQLVRVCLNDLSSKPFFGHRSLGCPSWPTVISSSFSLTALPGLFTVSPLWCFWWGYLHHNPSNSNFLVMQFL